MKAFEKAYAEARKTFDTYAGLDAPHLPPNPMSELQVLLHRWVSKKGPDGAGLGNIVNVLGMSEETGELIEAFLCLAVTAGRLSHIALKNAQKIRGLGDREAMRAAMTDAVADLCVFATQCCTELRVDFGTLYYETIKEVTSRDWVAHPADAHEVAHV